MVEPSEDLVLVFNKAVSDAKQLNHEYVTIEHLLFAALCTESLDKLLTAFGSDVAALKNALESYLKTECNDIVTIEKKYKPKKTISVEPVSYTHLTLPTKLAV